MVIINNSIILYLSHGSVLDMCLYSLVWMNASVLLSVKNVIITKALFSAYIIDSNCYSFFNFGLSWPTRGIMTCMHLNVRVRKQAPIKPDVAAILMIPRTRSFLVEYAESRTPRQPQFRLERIIFFFFFTTISLLMRKTGFPRERKKKDGHVATRRWLEKATWRG